MQTAPGVLRGSCFEFSHAYTECKSELVRQESGVRKRQGLIL